MGIDTGARTSRRGRRAAANTASPAAAKSRLGASNTGTSFLERPGGVPGGPRAVQVVVMAVVVAVGERGALAGGTDVISMLIVRPSTPLGTGHDGRSR
ncbi:hypothetical protein GCM10009696_34240 [Kocuria himachalensis]